METAEDKDIKEAKEKLELKVTHTHTPSAPLLIV